MNLTPVQFDHVKLAERTGMQMMTGGAVATALGRRIQGMPRWAPPLVAISGYVLWRVARAKAHAAEAALSYNDNPQPRVIDHASTQKATAPAIRARS